MNIFGVRIDDYSFKEVQALIDASFSSGKALSITTPNPEILLHARSHPAFTQCLNQSTIAVPDGFGLQLFTPVRNRVTGVELSEYVLQKANSGKLRVVCIVRQDGLSSVDDIVEAVSLLAPQAVVRGIPVSIQDKDDSRVVKLVSDFHPDIIFVGLGFPFQEEWVTQHAQSIRSLKIIVAVGGTFDYWTGILPRAPKPLRTIGLEWLWRLLVQPKRYKRIFRAVFLFPFFVLIDVFQRRG